ncbi:hypothetical protein CN947_23420 [Bacillus cereus]|nr:hypothetical protein CN947_23420 [Bacillus cereus]
MEDTIVTLSVEDRDQLCKLLTKSFIIPEPYREAVKKAMLKYQNNLTEQRAEELISKVFSPQDNFNFKFDPSNPRATSYSRWRGFFSEWLIAVQYNSFVNTGNVVITIVNPDPTSKCDLLHIIQDGDKYKCVPGPDVKTGRASYLLDQLEKICKEKREIPIFDADGILSEDGIKKLTKKQKERFKKLTEQYPKKKILQSKFSNADMVKITHDFLHYVASGELPSKRANGVPVNKEDQKKLLYKALDEVKRLKKTNVYPVSFNDCRMDINNKKENMNKNAQDDLFINNTKVSSNNPTVFKKVARMAGNSFLRVGKIAVNLMFTGAKFKAIEELHNINQKWSDSFNSQYIKKGKLHNIKRGDDSNTCSSDDSSLQASILPVEELIDDSDLVRKSPDKHWVNEYTKSNGTIVSGYFRGGDDDIA